MNVDVGRWQRIHQIAIAPVVALCRCGQPVSGHPRCRDCGILVGYGHAEEVSNEGRCSSCERNIEVRRVGRELRW